MITEQAFIAKFQEHFGELDDPRQASKVVHPIIEILFVAIVAVAGGAETWGEIEGFGKAHIAEFRKYFLFIHGIPSDDTIRRLFQALDIKAMNKILRKYFSSDSGGQHFCIDGKALRGSASKDARALHFLNVCVAETGLSLYGAVLDKKENEISAIPEALECLDIKGGIVSIDAMGCQKSIAQQIIDKGADYIFGLKENHAHLYNEVKGAFASNASTFFGMQSAESRERAHGREEFRKCRILHNVDKISGTKQWCNLKSYVEVYRKFRENGKTSETVNYYISSSSRDAEFMLKSIREHWKIESMHWILDVVFEEDKSRIKADNAPANIAIVRRFALNILNQIKEKRQTRPNLMKMIGWSRQHLHRFIAALNVGPICLSTE